MLWVELTSAKSVAGRRCCGVGSPRDGEVVLDAVGGGGARPRVGHRLVVAPLLQHELALAGVLDLTSVVAGEDADPVVLVVQVLPTLVVERLHQARRVKVILEAACWSLRIIDLIQHKTKLIIDLDCPGSIAEYLGDPQAPLVVGGLWSFHQEINFSLAVLQRLDVEVLLAVHLHEHGWLLQKWFLGRSKKIFVLEILVGGKLINLSTIKYNFWDVDKFFTPQKPGTPRGHTEPPTVSFWNVLEKKDEGQCSVLRLSEWCEKWLKE